MEFNEFENKEPEFKKLELKRENIIPEGKDTKELLKELRNNLKNKVKEEFLKKYKQIINEEFKEFPDSNVDDETRELFIKIAKQISDEISDLFEIIIFTNLVPIVEIIVAKRLFSTEIMKTIYLEFITPLISSLSSISGNLTGSQLATIITGASSTIAQYISPDNQVAKQKTKISVSETDI